MTIRSNCRIFLEGVLVGIADDLDFRAGANVSLVAVTTAPRGVRVTVAASGSGGGVDSIAKEGAAQLTGDVTLSEGTNVTLTQVGNDIEIAAAGAAGAPADVDYLVGTASGGLSAEIVVGTAPGGELGGTWASPTVDATHSGSAHHTEDHDHDGSPTSQLAQANTHQSPDTDSAPTALHHTLGSGANQSAAGNHSHAGGSAHTIKEAGTPLTDRAGLNFLAGFDLADDAGNNETEVAFDLSEVATGGDLSWSTNTPTINNDAVTFAKMQNITASRLLGRGTAAGDGDMEHITVGAGLTLSGTTLSSAAADPSFLTITKWGTD